MGGSAPEGEAWPQKRPSAQAIRSKIPVNSKSGKSPKKGKGQRNLLDFPRSSSIFRDLSSIFPRSSLDLPAIFPRTSSIFLDLPRSLHAPSIFLDLPRYSLDLPSIFLDLEIRTMGFEGGDHCVRLTHGEIWQCFPGFQKDKPFD